MTASELMEQGIQAYTRGQLGEAERCWRDVLNVDPGNARAQSYLELLLGKLVRAASSPGEAAPVRLPVPASRPSTTAPVPLPVPSAPASTMPRRTASAPVPLPTPAAPAWMQPPAAAAPVPGRDVTPAPAPVAAAELAPPPPVGGEPAAPPLFAAEAAPRPLLAADPAPAPVVGSHGALPAPLGSPEAAPAPFASYVPPPASFGSYEPAPAASALAMDEFASCWEGDNGEITAPITIAPSELPLSPVPPSDEPYTATLTPSASLPSSRPGRTTLSEYAPSPWDQGPASAPAVVLEDGVGLDFESVAEQSGLHPLVPEAIGREGAPRAPGSEVEIWVNGARELFALGDFSVVAVSFEKILKIDPSHAEAREYLKQNESTLIAMYESKLGPADAFPELAIHPEEVMWLNLDHRAGFLLAQIDGTVSYEDLFALSGLPRLDTARILAALLQEGVIKSS